MPEQPTLYATIIALGSIVLQILVNYLRSKQKESNTEVIVHNARNIDSSVIAEISTLSGLLAECLRENDSDNLKTLTRIEQKLDALKTEFEVLNTKKRERAMRTATRHNKSEAPKT